MSGGSEIPTPTIEGESGSIVSTPFLKWIILFSLVQRIGVPDALRNTRMGKREGLEARCETRAIASELFQKTANQKGIESIQGKVVRNSGYAAKRD
jgi:hypothetical protein